MTADFTEVVKLAGEIRNAGRIEIRKAVALEVGSTARKIAADGRANARRISHHIPGTIIVTGAAGEKLGALDLEAEIGPTLFWAHIPEYGSSQQAPRPYMGPAADKHLAPFAERLGAIGARLIA